MKNTGRVIRIFLGLVVFAVFFVAGCFFWRLWQESRLVDPEVLESLLPSLNVSAVKKAAELLRGS